MTLKLPEPPALSSGINGAGVERADATDYIGNENFNAMLHSPIINEVKA